MDPLLVFPDPPPPELAQTLDLAGLSWKAAANAAVAEQLEDEHPFSAAVVVADQDPEGAFALLRAMRKRNSPLEAVLLLVNGGQLNQLEMTPPAQLVSSALSQATAREVIGAVKVIAGFS